MDANDYQKFAARTLLQKPDAEYTHSETMLVWNALGLCGEAGEVAEHIKKGVFHRHGVDREKLKKELGDVAWYLASICTRAGLSLSDVLEGNITKLKARYPNGYNSADSLIRADTEAP